MKSSLGGEKKEEEGEGEGRGINNRTYLVKRLKKEGGTASGSKRDGRVWTACTAWGIRSD